MVHAKKSYVIVNRATLNLNVVSVIPRREDVVLNARAGERQISFHRQRGEDCTH